MKNHNCPGVQSLRTEIVLFTGKAHVDGRHVKRSVLMAFARAMGALAVEDESDRVTVLVHGDTWSGPLHDEARRYSQKATFVEAVERSTGRHVHVIDPEGFRDLTKGGPAACYQLRPPA